MRVTVCQSLRPLRALRYQHQDVGYPGFDLWRMSDLDSVYQDDARAQLAELLAYNPGWEVQTVRLETYPWRVDALVRAS